MGTTASRPSPASNDIKLLYSTAQPGADVDIVVVRVLPQSSDDRLMKPHHHWSDDYLYPEELQSIKSRILLFGLSTNLPLIHTSPSTAEEMLEQQALQLLELLFQTRKTTLKTRTRPLIFVAHGLASMLVDKALQLCVKNGWKLSWRHPNSYVLYHTHAVFLFSHSSPLGWIPHSWQPMKLNTATGFEHVEQNRLEIETLATSSFSSADSEPESRTLRCLHHALWPYSYWMTSPHLMRTPLLIITFLGQIYVIAALISSPILIRKPDSTNPNSISTDELWQILPLIGLYHFCANCFYFLNVRDKYQNKVMLLTAVVLLILAEGLSWAEGEARMVFSIVFSILTLSMALSALAHFIWPVWLANEETRSWVILERWVADVCRGGERVGDAVEENGKGRGIV